MSTPGFMVTLTNPTMNTNPRVNPERTSAAALRGACNLAILLAVGLGASSAPGQATNPAPNLTPPTNDEPVRLTPFTVTGAQVGRYQPLEAASGGRVAVALLDAPQSISVVSREVIEDSGGQRLLDALKYSTGVTESSIPGAQDRVAIRGFQTDGQRVDNFASYSQANLDTVFVERIEVVKGPNAVLAPAGVPGGTINLVTRKPYFNRDGGSVMVQLGSFDANRAELDVNQVWGKDKSTAFRVVAADQDTKGFAGNPRKVYAVMPMFSFRTKGGATLTLQTSLADTNVQNYFGLPLDPTVGTNDYARTLPGVARDFDMFDTDYRHERRHENRALLTLPLTDTIFARLAVRYAELETETMQMLPALAAALQGGSVDPRTGIYTPGVIFGAAPAFAATPAATVPRTFNRSGTRQISNYTYAMVQNDYVHTYKSEGLSLQTLVGFAGNMTRNLIQVVNGTKPAINYDNYVPGPDVMSATPANFQRTVNYDGQVYANETVGLLNGRLILTGSVSKSNYDLNTNDLRLNSKFGLNLRASSTSLGVLFHPIPNTSVYYSHSGNATPAGWPTTAYQVLATGARPFQDGVQNEYGARIDLLNHRVFATLAHFEIKQNNFGIQNPGNLASPPPVPTLGPLFSDLIAKGWEFELHLNITSAFSLVGSASSFTNRDPNNIPFRNSGERLAALMVNYRFAKESPLTGLSLMAGVDYLGRRAGDVASGLARGSTPTNVIPNQPTFYLAPRTLVNASASYSFKRNWTATVRVDNLFNNHYIATSLSRFAVVPGSPINAIGQLLYKF